ncbi:hypothetical protein FCULG_00004572 [Fusarium culmorum]|uniref:Rhodopsin domain-containing protein n=1 Tax=Fusarium culmorum TaxID=5516 RepID=A0A2T4H9J1_FUSCU|nr:hypothetical protein FCULG_00004572 [Fusarium culmorum]
MLFTREHETPFNKSPVVRAVSMILMVVTVFSVFIRLLTRLAAVKRLKYSTFFTSDEIMILTSMIFSIAQSTIVYTQSSNGLGKLDVSSSQVSSILKAQLGSDVLFFITLGLSKLSATSTIWTMSPLSNKTILPIQILIGGWAISAVLVRSFACSLPNPWDYLNGRCINMVAFWIYADAVNIGTDLLITALTLGILVHLQMPVGGKQWSLACLDNNPPTISHIFYYKRALNSTTPIFEMWMPTIINQVVQCLGIMTTCIPFWWRFLKSMESGQMGAGDIFGALSRSNNTKSGGTSFRGQAFELTCRPSTAKYGGTWDVDVARQNSQEALVDPSAGTGN